MIDSSFYIQWSVSGNKVSISLQTKNTGCPAKLFTLFISQLLSSWCTEDFHPGHFLTALFVGCWKLSKILKTVINVLNTGCPAKLFTLFILQFLSSWCTEDFHPRHFSTALFIGCWKLSKISKIEQYLTKLWREHF